MTKDESPVRVRREYAQGFLALATVVGFFGAIAALLYVDKTPVMKDTLLVMIGALVAQYKEVQGYFFGKIQPK